VIYVSQTTKELIKFIVFSYFIYQFTVIEDLLFYSRTNIKKKLVSVAYFLIFVHAHNYINSKCKSI